MAKKSVILLLVAALFAVILVGILFFRPSSITIEKFQGAVTATAPELSQGGAQAIPQGLVQAPRELTGPERAAAQFGRYQPPPQRSAAVPQIQAQPTPQAAPSVSGTVTPSVSGTVTPQGPSIAPVAADCTPGGNTYGYPSSDNTIRLYATEGCKALNGILAGNGECMRQGGGSFSWDCRGLNPVPAAEQCNTLYPPPPPPPPTLAECSSQFSCQTTLAPIGSSMIMPSRSTPAPIS